jgi:uncharacterized protein (UPF0335 family)
VGKRKDQPSVSGMSSNAADRLLSIIERIERLMEERAALAQDIADIFAEARSAGFDPTTIRTMIRERALTDAEREEKQALEDIYRAALGMLHGTPLGEAARRRISPPPPEPRPDPPPAAEKPPADEPPSAPDHASPPAAPAAPPPITPEDILAARAQGKAAAAAGRGVMENPFPAGDPRRAAWDEGYCAESGGDGMEIPAAWRRTKPSKPADPKPPGGP